MATGLPSSRRNILKSNSPLRFPADGEFRILHLSDIHLVNPAMDDDEDKRQTNLDYVNTLNVICRCIEMTDPDLVVFGGDNISGYWKEFTPEYMFSCIEDIVRPVREKNIPLAVVFGNHDSECEDLLPFLNRENQMTAYCHYDNFRGCFNDSDVYGCGNYRLQILRHGDDTPAWNIFCFDSNDYARNPDHTIIKDGGYDTVHPDQIAWYEQTAEADRQKYGRTVPAIAFQHIPVTQELDFVKYDGEGKFAGAKDSALLEGHMHENPCPPGNRDRSQFESWKKTGDMVAAFFGHDHVNTFRIDTGGISLYQTIGAGYYTYGEERGGRLIVLSENSEEIRTETLTVPEAVI